MALPWVKVFVSLLDNDVYRRLSAPARFTFLTAIPLAQKCDQGGALALRVGPLTIDEIAAYTRLPRANQQRALTELVAAGLLGARDDGAYVVERFAEFQGDSSRERTARYRARHGGVTAASRARHGDAIEGEGEEDTEGEGDAGRHNFGDLEMDVAAFVAVCASENRSGRITPGRVETIRRELAEALEQIGDRRAFTYGLREAIKHGAGAVNYAIKAATGYQPDVRREATVVDKPMVSPLEIIKGGKS